MWPYVAVIQGDFAARVRWVDAASFAEGEHAPRLTLQEGADFSVAPGETLVLHPLADSPDGARVTVTARIYPEASAACAPETELVREGDAVRVRLPQSAVPGDRIHILFKAQAEGRYRLTHYQQVIVTIT